MQIHFFRARCNNPLHRASGTELVKRLHTHCLDWFLVLHDNRVATIPSRSGASCAPICLRASSAKCSHLGSQRNVCWRVLVHLWPIHFIKMILGNYNFTVCTKNMSNSNCKEPENGCFASQIVNITWLVEKEPPNFRYESALINWNRLLN